MDYTEVNTEYGVLKFCDDRKAAFFKEYADKTLKDIFQLDDEDPWLKDTLFRDLNLTVRALNTISHSFAERDPEKETLYYVMTSYTPAKMITRRNAGPAFYEFMRVMYELIQVKDIESGKTRILDFDTEVFG